ncbi:MAG: NAD(P)H-binding protein [Solirubrobacterales bacterium]
MGRTKRSKMLVAGATGYIGRKLTLALAERGEAPRAMARTPGKAKDLAEAGAEVVPGDVLRQTKNLRNALEGVETAYYLVHSMGRGGEGDFADQDRTGAENFAEVAAEAGVERIVYLGGLSDRGSKHLESRHATAEYLGSTGVPVTYFRAAAVIGAGSESFRTLYYLVKRLPLMVTPKWVNNRTQPIAIGDVVEFLRRAPEVREAKGREIDIGGPDVTTYGGMMDALAKELGLRKRVKVPVPLLSPKLSSKWIGFVTPVDADVAAPLVEGLSVETVVKDHSGMDLFDFERIPMVEAMRLAIEEGGDELD